MDLFNDTFLKFLIMDKEKFFLVMNLVKDYTDHYIVIVVPDTKIVELDYVLWLSQKSSIVLDKVRFLEINKNICSLLALISGDSPDFTVINNITIKIQGHFYQTYLINYLYNLWFKEYIFHILTPELYTNLKKISFFDLDSFITSSETIQKSIMFPSVIHDNQFIKMLYYFTFEKVMELQKYILFLNWFENLDIQIYPKKNSLENIQNFIVFHIFKHRIIILDQSVLDILLSFFTSIFKPKPPFPDYYIWIYNNYVANNGNNILAFDTLNFKEKFLDYINTFMFGDTFYSYLFKSHIYDSNLNLYYYIYFRNEIPFETQKLFLLNFDLSNNMFSFLKENYWEHKTYKRIIYLLKFNENFNMKEIYSLLYHKESFEALYYTIRASDYYPLKKVIYLYIYALITECFGPFIILLISILIVIAYYTLNERKIIGYMQRRKGPNVVGIFGILQPISDGVKLFFKEMVIPTKSNSNLFLLAPVLVFFLALLSWLVIPFNQVGPIIDNDASILYIFALSSLNVYGIIIAGWASNSKYAFLGALRSAAQMISYEISIGLIVLSVAVCAGSLNLCDIVYHQEDGYHFWLDFPGFVMFLLSALAETNRSPFDLPEAEAELVSGYNVEYSSMTFALFFLGEYANMILMSALTVILFFGGWLPIISFELSWDGANLCIDSSFWFAFKVSIVMFVFVWVRATLPRLRYDQLMYLGWKVLLPLSLGWLIFLISFVEISGSPFEGELYEFSEYFISYFDKS